MFIYDNCQSAIRSCMDYKLFAIAWLYNNEKAMGIHNHDCYEIYFSISGGKQFFIDNQIYNFCPGDIFFINQSESHYISKVDQATHERVVVFIHPEYLKSRSTTQTDLSYCFTCRNTVSNHNLTLSKEEGKRFIYYIHKLSEDHEFGQDILEQAFFLEMITFLNQAFRPQQKKDLLQKPNNVHIDEILSYINHHLGEDLSIPILASHFYLSSSYLCKIFKDNTGTTINRYITAKRISWAKVLLAEGHSMTEASDICGFRDYSTFLKAFTKTVGISPKKYASYTGSYRQIENIYEKKRVFS